ncbi:hypothetical protein P879_11985, partial [Paragonimus westermani]
AFFLSTYLSARWRRAIVFVLGISALLLFLSLNFSLSSLFSSIITLEPPGFKSSPGRQYPTILDPEYKMNTTRVNSTTGINWLAPQLFISDKTESQNETGSLPPVSYHVHAFYYAWYNAPYENQSTADDRHWVHWNHARLAHRNQRIANEYSLRPHRPPGDIGASFYPQIGPYASKDKDTLKAHFNMATFAGVGELIMFVSSLHSSILIAISFRR